MDVKTAARVFDVINLFAEVRQPMIYSEIARRTEIPLSSCHALLQTMVAKGWLYAPGVKAGYYPTQRLLHVARDICAEDPLTLLFRCSPPCVTPPARPPPWPPWPATGSSTWT